jgi:predicted  nucleic acid-binding Zn-ribbon protein
MKNKEFDITSINAYENEIEKMEEYIKQLENEISDLKEENMLLREDLKDCQRILDKNDMEYGRDDID